MTGACGLGQMHVGLDPSTQDFSSPPWSNRPAHTGTGVARPPFGGSIDSRAWKLHGLLRWIGPRELASCGGERWHSDSEVKDRNEAELVSHGDSL